MSKLALISVTQKDGVEIFAKFLAYHGFTICSTGGTYKYLLDYFPENSLVEISSLTGHQEILGGRVKTLHPAIHGGILAKNNNIEHQSELTSLGISNIEVVVVNLYQFSEGIKENNSEMEALELIDIGGHTLIRAAAKNYPKVLVVVNPLDYTNIMENWSYIDETFRRQMAGKAFRHIMEYDLAISDYFNKEESGKSKELVVRQYSKVMDLKYGCNPHQKISGLYTNIVSVDKPIKVLNGNLAGYINILDAINGWNLVRELREELGYAAVASFKHTSPAGVGLGIPITDSLNKVYRGPGEFSDLAVAFVRARNADPLSSFGDFIALSDVVDEETATFIQGEVSDGIIAPGYTPEALEILMEKRGGKYLILEVNKGWNWNMEGVQYRELNGGVVVSQNIDNVRVGKNYINDGRVVSDRNKYYNDEVQRDLILANITLKYTQSNSVVYACGGQVIGVGAGQQNRVDCVKLAGWKAETWVLRQMPEMIELLKNGFKTGIALKRQDKINAIYDYLESCRRFGQYWDFELDQSGGGKFKEPMSFLGLDVRKEFCQKFYQEHGIVMASDAFFPFVDSILVARRHGVRFISHPGGGQSDEVVREECHRRGIGLVETGVRIFTH